MVQLTRLIPDPLSDRQMAGGNTLGATGFTVYGLWWISWGYSLSSWSGIAEAYATNPTEMESSGLAPFHTDSDNQRLT